MKLSGIAKFLSLHATELSATAGVLSRIVSALPIGRDDKDAIDKVLSDLEESAKSIAASAPAFAENKVTIKRSDVDAAIARLLPGAVAAELKRLGIEKVSAEGNGA